jgi:hypothetical protein
MLRNEPPFQPLRLGALSVTFPEEGENDADEAPVLALAADVAAHASLRRAQLSNAPLHTPAALDAVVDAALARKLVSLSLRRCSLSPASAPALARLLGGGTLTELCIPQNEHQLLDAPSAALLGAALRANSTITTLRLSAGLWQNPDAAAVLLGALTGHCSVRALRLPWNNHVEEPPVGAAAGAALGALIAANAPALMELDVSMCHLGDEGLRPLFEALPANTYLRTLVCSWNDISQAFAADVLLPAVRANSSLRTLLAAHTILGQWPPLEEAAELVRHRAQAAAAGVKEG